MKKIISALMMLVMLLSLLASCGESTTSAATETPSVKSETEETTPDVPTDTPTDQTESTVSTLTPIEPTESETETETETVPEDPTHDALGGMLEEAMGVLPVGQYRIVLAGSDRTLSYDHEEKDDKIDVEPTVGGELNTFTIVYQTHKENPYYIIFAGEDSMHTLATEELYRVDDGDKVVFRGKQRLREGYWDDKSETMQWQILDNGDGTYSFKSNVSGSNLFLCEKDGKLSVNSPENAAGNGSVCSFKLELVKRGGGNAFLQYISDGGDVVVRVPTNTKTRTRLTDEQLQLWANHLEDAYNSYIDLTSFVAYESVVVKAYEPSPHIGYVWNSSEHYNVITIQNTFMIGDLTKMATRAKKFGAEDWNFCALHEMGHMFDNGRAWCFEGEMMTDLKVAYVLQANGGCAAPSEFGFADYFYADKDPEHKQIEKCYLSLSADSKPIAESLKYGAYGAALKFVEIQRAVDDDNWTVFKAVYADIQERGLKIYRNYERFENLVDTIAEKSGKDVRAMFTEDEWNVYMSQCGYTG